VVLATGLTVLAVAVPASAHVTVNPRTAEQGGYGKFSFRVPNERDVPTTKVEIVLPADHPIASVSVRPVPGWQVTPVKTKLAKPIEAHGSQITEAVTTITATGGTVLPGQFQEFDVSMGPLPTDTDRLVFKALQTYANGEVVRWIQVAQEGQEEPEHPAPVLALTPAAPDKGAATAATSEVAAQNASDTDNGGSGSDTLARVLGGLGLLVGLAGAAVAALALRRRTP
jgi:uncharacterized protein YcnI